MSGPKYTVIESRRWFNPVSGRSASLYGCAPFVGEQGDWVIQSCGWTVRNNRNNTVGIGRQPWETKAEAEAFAAKWN